MRDLQIDLKRRIDPRREIDFRKNDISEKSIEVSGSEILEEGNF